MPGDQIKRSGLARIERLNPALNAFVAVDAEVSLAQARKADELFAQGLDLGPLHGIPVAIKDNIDTFDHVTTYGSAHFEGFRPTQDALCVQRLREGGDPRQRPARAALAAVFGAERKRGRGKRVGLSLLLVMALALPLWLAGVRTSVIVNIGTAAIASTVGAKTLGSPIIVGLSGFNTAYVLQGAVLVGLLAIAADMGFERLSRRVQWAE